MVETTCFDVADEPDVVSFMDDVNSDPSNWWALSTPVMDRIFARLGFEPLREIYRTTTPVWDRPEVSRVIVATRKPWK